MSVQASTIFGQVRSLLDDDNSVRYTEAKDLIPAINAAIDYVTSVFSAAFEQKKLQPFALSELTTIWMYEPTVTGSTAFVDLDSHGSDVFNDKVWTIIGVDPNPGTGVGGVFADSNEKFATRVHADAWGFVLDDPFKPGYADVPADFTQYAYTGPGNYFGDGKPYLMLRPSSAFTEGESYVGVWLLLKHAAISAGTSEILFPVTIHNLIVQKMVQLITFQGDDERLFKITDKEVKELIQLMN